MAQLNVNLLVNPGAENSPGAPEFNSIFPPTGWTTTPDLTAVTYAAGGSSDLNIDDSAAVNGGDNYFAGGPGGSGLATATQRVDFSNLAAKVDASSLQVNLSAFLGGFSIQTDDFTVVANFLDASGTIIGSVSIGPVSNTDRDNISQLLFRNTTVAIPVGARSADVVLESRRFGGSYNDGYADNLGFKITEKTVPVSGNASDNNITGTSLSNQINGANGNDTISGLGGDDFIAGDRGADRLIGGNGDDTLFGGLGNDRLIGSGGRDIFVLQSGNGRDTITDFQNGQDFIGLSGGLSFSDLDINQITNASQIIVSSTQEILVNLNNITADQITATDFTIV
jgi:Ca2+-binding RTX toxin-like protein